MNNKLDTLTKYLVPEKEHSGIQHSNEAISDPRPHRTSRPRRRTHSSGILDQPQSLCPGFRGPTSSSFIFEVAKDSLEKMGLNSNITTGGIAANQETSAGTSIHQYSGKDVLCAVNTPEDVFYGLNEVEVLRLCQEYDQTLGTMYPVLDMSKVLSNVHRLYTHPRTSLSSDTDRDHFGFGEDDPNFELNILKLICAVALTSAGNGEHAKAQMLYDDVRDSADAPIWDAMGITGLQYLTLVVSL